MRVVAQKRRADRNGGEFDVVIRVLPFGVQETRGQKKRQKQNQRPEWVDKCLTTIFDFFKSLIGSVPSGYASL